MPPHAISRWVHRMADRVLGGLAVHRFGGMDEYRAWIAKHGPEGWVIENALAAKHPQGEFTYRGECWIDRSAVDFQVDYRYAFEYDGKPYPNWRERLVCPRCGLNNRQRAVVHLASESLGLSRRSRIYITEQISPVYAALAARHPATIGSEFLGPERLPGHVDERGIRHEDLTRLSLADASVDAVLTFDVLEHVPRFEQALAECARVLAPGGALMLSVPFLQDSEATRRRARLDGEGRTVHLHPPQFHGDPVNPEAGVLCWQEFGWDLLEQLREAGFEDPAAWTYRSERFGYLGGWPLVFVARKPA